MAWTRIQGILVLFSLLIGLLSFPLAIGVAAAADEPADPRRAMRLLESPPRQQIPLADDRFRIDYEIEEVTLVFFRDPDTAPIVVILPDGSKWYASRHPREDVSWHSGHDYDMIRIRNPMPGPWQVSGRIRPESRVMVVTDIEFIPQDFPELAFVGERMMMTGRILENGEPIEQRDFRSVVRLELFLHSTNNPEFDNFGTPPTRIGEFLDDGRGLDARPRDGIFTGEFVLKVPSGEYIPHYRVRTPLHQRATDASPILVRRRPVLPEVDISTHEEEPHVMRLRLDEEYIQTDDLVISGRIEFPNGEFQRVSISTKQGDSLVVRIPNYTFGVFEVDLDVHGTDVNGREFRTTIPTFEFRSQRPRDPGPTPEELERLEREAQDAEHQARIDAIADERQQKRQRFMWILIFNILVASGFVFYLMLRNQLPSPEERKEKKAAKARKKAAPKAAAEAKKAAAAAKKKGDAKDSTESTEKKG
ncbi:MAG: TIGR03503 family protein [Idiomarina sp.]|nr:TIGR03503 family protein [Idiomarina sp.]